jgi:hypothetical protein
MAANINGITSVAMLPTYQGLALGVAEAVGDEDALIAHEGRHVRRLAARRRTQVHDCANA